MNTYKNCARRGALSKLAILIVDQSVLFTTETPMVHPGPRHLGLRSLQEEAESFSCVLLSSQSAVTKQAPAPHSAAEHSGGSPPTPSSGPSVAELLMGLVLHQGVQNSCFEQLLRLEVHDRGKLRRVWRIEVKALNGGISGRGEVDASETCFDGKINTSWSLIS